TVDEIDIAAGRNAAQERTFRARDFKLVPTDLRNLEAVVACEANDFALENAKAAGATIELFAPLEQRLVADANTEEWTPGLDEFPRGFEQFLLLECVDAIIKGAHARQNRRSGAVYLRGPLDNPHLSADFQQCFVDASKVARTIVYQSNHANIIRRIPGYGNQSGVSLTPACSAPCAREWRS